MTSVDESLNIFEALLNKTPEFTDLAFKFGPYFFGTFLVIIAVLLLWFNKYKIIASLFAICGIGFMIVASYNYFVNNSSIFAYFFRIENLKENQSILLTDSPPKLYKHNKFKYEESDTHSIDLLAISTVQLEEGHTFRLILSEKFQLMDSEGNGKITRINNTILFPFKGGNNLTYYLKKKELVEGESGDAYELVYINRNSKGSIASILSKMKLVSDAYAQPPNTFTKETFSNILKKSQQDNVAVIYNRRSADEGKVDSALKSTGIPYGVKLSSFNKPVNAVWVGIDVSNEIVEIITNALIQHGVELKFVGNFDSKNSKTNVIEIGYSAKNDGEPIIEKNDLEKFSTNQEEIQNSNLSLKYKEMIINDFSESKINSEIQKQMH